MGLERINEIKKEMGITTDDLSERSGVPVGTLNKILSGQTKDPKLETLKSIARVLGCTLDEFDDDGSEASKFTQVEMLIVRRYRTLDDHGRKLIDAVLEIECERCSEFVKRGDSYAAEELKEVARANEKDFNPNTSDGDSFRRAMYRIKDQKKGEQK